MKYDQLIIYYFSGTGNARNAAMWITHVAKEYGLKTHLIKGFTISLQWQLVMVITSCLAALGGLLVLVLVPDGPHRRASDKMDFSVLSRFLGIEKCARLLLATSDICGNYMLSGHLYRSGLLLSPPSIPIQLIIYRYCHFRLLASAGWLV